MLQAKQNMWYSLPVCNCWSRAGINSASVWSLHSHYFRLLKSDKETAVILANLWADLKDVAIIVSHCSDTETHPNRQGPE